MRHINKSEHNATIIKQFTEQAIPFTKLPGHLDSIQLLIEISQAAADDIVLDVACGPGLVACEFAKVTKHVTGIDLTEKMIEQAAVYQKQQGVNNLCWDIGTAYALPYDANTFSIVVTRYSFHHLLNPAEVLSEMRRVCQPGGIIVIADVALPADKVAAYNHMEKLRDPSHTQALSHDNWANLLASAGLKNLRRSDYNVPMELEAQLRASFPNPGDSDRIRALFENDININNLGVAPYKVGDEIHFAYPISIYAGEK